MTADLNDTERFNSAVELAARLVRELGDDRHKALAFAFDYWQAPASRWFDAQTELLKALK